MERCCEKNTRVEFKNTKDEYTVRTSFILGVASNWASISWYEYKIVTKCNIDPLEFEIRKEYVYKRKFKAKVLVIYTILSKREILD